MARKAFLITTGTCYPHQTDFNLIRAYLRNSGWVISKKVSSANAVIINTCAFIKANEDRSLRVIRRVQERKNKDAKMIVVGCLPAINRPALTRAFRGSAVSANSLSQLNQLLGAKLSLNEINYIGSDRALKKNKSAEYLLRIGWGCNEKCSYCAVRFVFGKPRSRPQKDIQREFDIAYGMGYRRFVLVANDTGSYGDDSNTSIIRLLHKLCRKHGDCEFALSHLTPNKLKEMLPRLENLLRSRRIWQMNIPAESGSNRIMRLMRRRYTVEDFKFCVKKLLGYNPDIEIKTDIIVGFPTETEEDFLETLKLVEWLGRYKVIFQCLSYSKRPGTKASKMLQQMDEITKRNRLEKLNVLCEYNEIFKNKKLFTKLSNKIKIEKL